MTLQVLRDKGLSFREIATTLGVSEGTVRYHRKRQGRLDGRGKPRKAGALSEFIDAWVAQQHPEAGDIATARPINVLDLFEWLRLEHAYDGSYRSVLRFVRDRYPKPRLRPYRRVETPPGAQAQVDWGEFSGLDIGGGPQKVHAFVMVLSHSRKEVLVWSLRMDQCSWHQVHNEALRRLGGVPAVLRIDNLKTGIAKGAGPWGEVNPAYQAYAKAVGFHVDACLPRCPEHKGKVENKVRFVKRRLRLSGTFSGLADLQKHSDEQLAASDGQRVCPATGLPVQQSFEAEQRLLRPLPYLPEPFDLAVTRTVQRDCTVNFEGRTYSVPFVLCGLQVEVRGCLSVVQVWHEGQRMAEHPRQTQERLLIESSHYEGEGNERVIPPVPLGRMGRRLQEIYDMPVEQRPLDLYAALMEGKR